jgi:hypothetical protein
VPRYRGRAVKPLGVRLSGGFDKLPRALHTLTATPGPLPSGERSILARVRDEDWGGAHAGEAFASRGTAPDLRLFWREVPSAGRQRVAPGQSRLKRR